MKKILIVLYTIIFLLIASINVISIKKYFDLKQTRTLNDIVAFNFVPSLVSFNQIEQEVVVITNTSITDDNKETYLVEVEKDKKENEEPGTIEDSEGKNKEEIIQEEHEIELNENIQDESINNQLVSEDTGESTNNNSILFDGLTEDELVIKLEKSLKNELTGTGINFVNYYKNTGLDPYLAVAIVLHETGCTWKCSSLVRECYNYGGMKGGTNKYKDTNYTCYASKEEGINAYLNMLYNNYYSKGLTTAELINPKYATSLEWAVKINNYIEKIKNK